jgi:hypothetical protein
MLAGLTMACVLTFAAGPLVSQETRDGRREMMYGNFEALMNVMFLLSKREYAEAAKEVRTIEKHGEELAKPSGQPTLFHSYARSLKAHAENLRTLADVLGAGGHPDPELEFLHDAVAADFGQIAATCVACHGHFLPDKKK